jgi:desulfoferrodoxin (superoxide reductase-like protein)
MKKFLILILAVFTVAVFYGHPPTGIDFTYDLSQDNGVLTVNVNHSLKTSPVSDPAKHYIKEVVLKVNGKQVEKQTFSKQDTIDGQIVIFKAKLKEGDKVSVSATCNMIGSKSVSYVIPKKQ